MFSSSKNFARFQTPEEEYWEKTHNPNGTTGVRTSLQEIPPIVIKYAGGGITYILGNGDALHEVVVIRKGKTGKNILYKDKSNNRIMTTEEFCDAINQGLYQRYWVSKNGVPKSAQNRTVLDNLG